MVSSLKVRPETSRDGGSQQPDGDLVFTSEEKHDVDFHVHSAETYLPVPHVSKDELEDFLLSL